MRVRLLLFAQYRDAAGSSELTLEVPTGASALDAVRVLRMQGPSFQSIPEQPVIAVNLEYASLDRPLNEDDELALLPPVSGG